MLLVELERLGALDRMKTTQTQVHELRGVYRVIRPVLRLILLFEMFLFTLQMLFILCSGIVPSSAIIILFFLKILMSRSDNFMFETICVQDLVRSEVLSIASWNRL